MSKLISVIKGINNLILNEATKLDQVDKLSCFKKTILIEREFFLLTTIPNGSGLCFFGSGAGILSGFCLTTGASLEGKCTILPRSQK